MVRWTFYDGCCLGYLRSPESTREGLDQTPQLLPSGRPRTAETHRPGLASTRPEPAHTSSSSRPGYDRQSHETQVASPHAVASVSRARGWYRDERSGWPHLADHSRCQHFQTQASRRMRSNQIKQVFSTLTNNGQSKMGKIELTELYEHLDLDKFTLGSLHPQPYPTPST